MSKTTNPIVITVHEIGYEDYDYLSIDMMTYLHCGVHFVKLKTPTRRNIFSTAIKSIEPFELPVYKFSTRIERKFKIFKKEVLEYRKIEIVHGCRISFVDGSTMYVSEPESYIKSIVESHDLAEN